MKIIKHVNAIKIFYYMMAIDGSIQNEEIEMLTKLGKEIDKDHFDEYKEELFDSCQKIVDNALNSSDTYDMLSEQIDEEFKNQTDDPMQGVTSRMLVWNMFVTSLANEEYSNEERRIIRHIVRLCEIEESVYLEMEQIINSFVAVDKELKEMQSSSLPYSEIRPLVDELENRKTNLNNHAIQLIADELVSPVEVYEAKEDFVDKAMNAYHKKVDPILQKTGDTIGSTFNKVKEKAAPVNEKVKNNVKKLWGGIKEKIGSKKSNEPSTEEE